jgi:hypothetical protein
VGPALQLDAFLDSMLRSRITRRVLAEQHLHISGGGRGIVDGSLGVADAAEFAGQRAAMLCAEVRGEAGGRRGGVGRGQRRAASGGRAGWHAPPPTCLAWESELAPGPGNLVPAPTPQVYGVAPEVRVSGDIAAVLPYIPSHLDYMLYEVRRHAGA